MFFFYQNGIYLEKPLVASAGKQSGNDICSSQLFWRQNQYVFSEKCLVVWILNLKVVWPNIISQNVLSQRNNWETMWSVTYENVHGSISYNFKKKTYDKERTGNGPSMCNVIYQASYGTPT